jgi:hypothetical protein
MCTLSIKASKTECPAAGNLPQITQKFQLENLNVPAPKVQDTQMEDLNHPKIQLENLNVPVPARRVQDRRMKDSAMAVYSTKWNINLSANTISY